MGGSAGDGTRVEGGGCIGAVSVARIVPGDGIRVPRMVADAGGGGGARLRGATGGREVEAPCLATGETSDGAKMPPPGHAIELSGVKTLLVIARPNALMDWPSSGNIGVPGVWKGGGLNDGGVEVVAFPARSSLRYLTMPST